jgi:ABC-type polysaccharide/polyol phosphate export permease
MRWALCGTGRAPALGDSLETPIGIAPGAARPPAARAPNREPSFHRNPMEARVFQILAQSPLSFHVAPEEATAKRREVICYIGLSFDTGAASAGQDAAIATWQNSRRLQRQGAFLHHSGRRQPMLTALRELFRYREFFAQIVLQQIRTRYRGSVLGFLWTLLNPLMVFLSLSFIFSYINHWDLKTFGVYFFSGYVPWIFFSNVTVGATTAIVGNSLYVTRIYAPRLIFPLATVAVNLVDFGAGLAILLALVLVMGAPLTAAWLVVPLGVLLLALFAAGLGLLFAAMGVFFRDFQFLWSNVAFLLFFLCPILYPVERLPPSAREYMQLNPVVPFLQFFQQPASGGTVPSLQTVFYALFLAVAAAVVGYATFVRTERRFYLYI